MGDALALRGDERRDKLRKVTGIGTHELIRSFSQLITSFIASESQGIPHTPLFCLFILFLVERLKV